MSDALPGSQAAIYLEGAKRGGLKFQGSNGAGKHFLKTIPTATLDGLPTAGASGGRDEAIVLSGQQAAQWLRKGVQRPDSIVMAKPVRSGAGAPGMLLLALPQDQPDKRQAITVLDLAANIVQNQLTLSSALESAQATNEFLSNLVSQAGSFDLASTSDVLLAGLVQEVKNILNFDALTVCIQSPEGQGRLRIEWAQGVGRKYSRGFTFAAAGVILGEIYRSAQPLLIGDLPAAGFAGRYVAGDMVKSRFKSLLGVPMSMAGMPKGTIVLESRQVGHFDVADLDALRATSQVYGAALLWSRKYRALHAEATVDGLTQLVNHSFLLDRLEAEVERASRYGETLTFLMLDLDHFKNVNDTYGHLFGDYVLAQTAQLVKAGIRKADLAGRYGGEEFGVIIINATTKTSLSTAQRIRNSIAGFKFRDNGIEARISVSIGMAEYPEDGQDSSAILQRADEAMYRVKRQGGNAVVSYSGDAGAIEQEAK
ncbi:MAG: sensor domain-containing diguanylate cyclase [Candidatus Neomarinimicrobiota bacterium]